MAYLRGRTSGILSSIARKFWLWVQIHVFCAWIQFYGWYQTLFSWEEEGKSEGQKEGEDGFV